MNKVIWSLRARGLVVLSTVFAWMFVILPHWQPL